MACRTSCIISSGSSTGDRRSHRAFCSYRSSVAHPWRCVGRAPRHGFGRRRDRQLGPQSGSAWHVRRAGARTGIAGGIRCGYRLLSALTDVLIVLAEAVCACVGFAWVHGTTRWCVALVRRLALGGRALRTSSRRDRISLRWLRRLDTLVGAIRHLATVLAPSIAQAVGSGGAATMQSLLGSLSAATTSASTVAAGMPAAFSDLATAAGGLAVAAGGLAAALLSGLMGLLVGMATAGARLLGGATVQLGAGIGAGAATVSAGATNAATSVGVSASQAATSIGASASQAGPAVGGVVTSAGGTIGMVASGIVAKVCALWTSLVGVASLLCLAILATFSSQLAAAGSGLASAVDAAHGAAAAGAGAVVSGDQLAAVTCAARWRPWRSCTVWDCLVLPR